MAKDLSDFPSQNNLSVFPEQVDTFLTHYDVGATDVQYIQEFQTLRSKGSLTSAELERMNTLLSAMRDKLFLAEDFNKLQDAITNLETFFKWQTEDYISQLFTQYDLRMLAMEEDTETRLTAMENASDAKIKEISDKITETTAWQNSLMAEMYNSQYFDFDNLIYQTGFTRKTEKTSDSVTVETIYNMIDNSVFATRTSTKKADADYEIVTVCDRVVPAINVKSHIYKRDGIWMEDITAN